MFNVFLCVTTEHDWQLVLVAAIVCLTATLATFFLYAKVPAFPSWRRWAWLSLTGLVAGSGIWTTHFVGMLAFETGLPTGYALVGTVGSMIVAIVCTTTGFAVGSALIPRRNLTAVAGGLIVGLGITLMHYVGMSGYRTQGRVEWSSGYVMASVLIGGLFATIALYAARPGSGLKRQAVASGLLTLAIVGMHFTGMTAVTIIPDSTIIVPTSLMSTPMMVVTTVAVTALILIIAIGGVLFDAATRNGNLKRLREAIDAMPEGLAFYDAADRLVAWNIKYADLCRGYIADLVVGTPFAKLLQASIAGGDYPETAGRERAWLAERMAAREAAVCNLEQQTAAGRWLRVTDRRTANGGVVSVCVDITDLKRAEAAMAKARDESEEANRTKSEFLANMSHEIRTPMNGIIGMTELLLGTELDDEQKKFAEAVRESGESLLGIINDILDISKLEAGKVEIESVDFDLTSLVENCAWIVAPKARSKGIDLGSFIDLKARKAYRGDPTRVRQILLNLLGNAVKFTDKGGVSLQVSAKTSAGDDSHVDSVRFEITDTGIGMPETVRERLFEKFSQADSSITRRFGGTGLGLAISKELAELMGGEIGVTSGVGRGSTFWVEVPLIRSTALLVERQRLPQQLKKLHTLVVDDVEMNREIIGRQLESFGMTVEKADNGFAALAVLERAWHRGTPFDIVFLDHMMPGLSGASLARRIRSIPTLSETKLVLVSSAGPSGMERGTSEALDAVIEKPVRQHELIDALTRIFGADARNSGAPSAAPAASAGKSEPKAEMNPKPTVPPLSILVAEDNKINQEFVRIVLTKAGHAVDLVENGHQAVDAVRRRNYDVVLMDMQMPELDGVAATHQIRALDPPRCNIPIIALTAHAMGGAREQYLAEGMNDYVSKPIHTETLLAKLAELAGRRAGEELLFLVEPRPSPPLAADLDESTLRSLTGVMPADSLLELFKLYTTSADERIVEINRQLKLGDLGAVGREAHITIGSAGNLGVARVSALAIRLETACKANNMVEAQAAAADLTAAHAVAAVAVRDWIVRRADVAGRADVNVDPTLEAALT